MFDKQKINRGKNKKMTIVRNKKGQVSERLSRSTENWERGRGAKRKGNPSYKPEIRNGKKVYVVRKDSNSDNMSVMAKFKKKLGNL